MNTIANPVPFNLDIPQPSKVWAAFEKHVATPWSIEDPQTNTWGIVVTETRETLENVLASDFFDLGSDISNYSPEIKEVELLTLFDMLPYVGGYGYKVQNVTFINPDLSTYTIQS